MKGAVIDLPASNAVTRRVRRPTPEADPRPSTRTHEHSLRTPTTEDVKQVASAKGWVSLIEENVGPRPRTSGWKLNEKDASSERRLS